MKAENVDSGITEKFRCSVDEPAGEDAFVSNQQRSTESKLGCDGAKLFQRPFAED